VKIRKAMLALTTVAALVTGTFAMVVPAHADGGDGDAVSTIELKDRGGEVTLGEIQTAIEKATKEKVDGPDRVAVVSDTGKYLSEDQLDAALAGRGTGDVKVYRTVDKPAAGTSLAELTKGTPLPAKTVYRTAQKRVHVEVVVACWPGGCIVIVVVIVHRHH
jgi:hypothetical protein